MLGKMVQVKTLENNQEHTLYAGWCGVVIKVEGSRAFVDSDEYVRRTGNRQGVSFKQWFIFDVLREL